MDARGGGGGREGHRGACRGVCDRERLERGEESPSVPRLGCFGGTYPAKNTEGRGSEKDLRSGTVGIQPEAIWGHVTVSPSHLQHPDSAGDGECARAGF